MNPKPPLSACCKAPIEEIYVNHVVDENVGAIAGGHDEDRCTKCDKPCAILLKWEQCDKCKKDYDCKSIQDRNCDCVCHNSGNGSGRTPEGLREAVENAVFYIDTFEKEGQEDAMRKVLALIDHERRTAAKRALNLECNDGDDDEPLCQGCQEKLDAMFPPQP